MIEIVFIIIAIVIVFYIMTRKDTSGEAARPNPLLAAVVGAISGFISAVAQLAALALFGGAIWYFFLRETGFSDADIEAAKASIKSEFEKRAGVQVTSVALMRERDNKARLIGLAKVKFGEVEATKSCAATMGDDRSYIWECK